MPQKARTIQNEQPLVAPIIDVGDAQQPVWRIGDEETVSVKVLGNPTPVVRWQIGRRRVKESSRYSLSTEELKKGRGWRHSLVIKNVTQDLEQGLWVTAENDAGQDCVMIEIKTYALISGAQTSPTSIGNVSFNDTNSVASLNIWQKEMEKRNYMRSVDDLAENPHIFTNNHNSSFDPNTKNDDPNYRRKNKKSKVTNSASEPNTEMRIVSDPAPPYPRASKAGKTNGEAAESNDTSTNPSEPVRRQKKRRDRIGSKVSMTSDLSAGSYDRQDSDLSGYYVKGRRVKDKSLDRSITSELLVTDFDLMDPVDSSLDHGHRVNLDSDNLQPDESGSNHQQSADQLENTADRKRRKKKRSSKLEHGDSVTEPTVNGRESVKLSDDKIIKNKKDLSDNEAEFENGLNIDDELFQLLGVDLSELCAQLLSGTFDPAGINNPIDPTFINDAEAVKNQQDLAVKTNGISPTNIKTNPVDFENNVAPYGKELTRDAAADQDPSIKSEVPVDSYKNIKNKKKNENKEIEPSNSPGFISPIIEKAVSNTKLSPSKKDLKPITDTEKMSTANGKNELNNTTDKKNIQNPENVRTFEEDKNGNDNSIDNERRNLLSSDEVTDSSVSSEDENEDEGLNDDNDEQDKKKIENLDKTNKVQSLIIDKKVKPSDSNLEDPKNFNDAKIKNINNKKIGDKDDNKDDGETSKNNQMLYKKIVSKNQEDDHLKLPSVKDNQYDKGTNDDDDDDNDDDDEDEADDGDGDSDDDDDNDDDDDDGNDEDEDDDDDDDNENLEDSNKDVNVDTVKMIEHDEKEFNKIYEANINAATKKKKVPTATLR